MEKLYNWKKKLFSNTYRVFENDIQIAELRNKNLSQHSDCTIKGEKYYFVTKGFFKQNTKILDKNRKQIGSITYNSWNTSATINLNDISFIWKNENIWRSKWSIFDNEGNKISYKGSSSYGNIKSYTDDEVQIITGLFVSNYFLQNSIIFMLIVLIPAWINIIN